MIPGIKIWQEPHGGWTAACYNTSECIENDWHHVLPPHEDHIIQEWMRINVPIGYFDANTGLAEFGYDAQAAEAAFLFKMKFQGNERP